MSSNKRSSQPPSGQPPPRRRACATTEILDGEAVVHSSESRALHVLNGTGTAIWEALDDHDSLDDLAAALSELYGAPYEVVRADVLEAVRSFGEMGLLEGVQANDPRHIGPRSDDPTARAQNGFAPIGSFGCDTARVERLAWAPIRPYRVGPQMLGIRANTGDVDGLLRAALADHVVEDVTPPHANYSIRIESATDKASSQPLHLLYEGGCLIARSRHAQDVIGALLHNLGARAPQPAVGPRVWCTPFRRRDGSAVLASAVTRRRSARQDSQLRAQGLELLHAPAVRFDPETAEVVIPSPALSIGWEPLSAITGSDERNLSDMLTEQRLPLRSWVFMSAPGAFEPMGRADALALAAKALVDDDFPRNSALNVLARALAGAAPIAAGDLHSPDVVERLSTLG